MNATKRPWDRTNLTIHTRRTSLCPALAIARVYESGIETEAAETVEQATANVELIVRAVNSYDAMREALEQAIARIEVANQEGNPIMSAWLPDAKAALALAKGE